jgi:hypothetical protein
MMQPLLTIPAYLAPIEHFAYMANHPSIIMEQWANYQKKTYRNRAILMGANGPISLSVPVVKPASLKTPDKDVRIAFDMPWQANQWRTIVSAYRSSPFFEYYADDLAPFYNKKEVFLIDLNIKLTQAIIEALGMSVEVSLSNSYIDTTTEYCDIKHLIEPSIGSQKNLPAYRQVFSDRHGFVPNLSILDLLFCKGPEAVELLINSTTNN